MPKGVANTKKATAIKAILEVIIPAFFERNQPDKPILTSKLKQPTLYPINIEAHKTSINVGSNIRGKLGSCEICKRHDATTATNKEQAASADDATIQLTDFLGEENRSRDTGQKSAHKRELFGNRHYKYRFRISH
jgi:hypothetical protein